MRIPFTDFHITLTRGLFKYNNNDPKYGLRSIFGATVGRTPVTEETALSIAAFWAGVRLISEKVAEFPTDVLQINQDGTRNKVPHPTLSLLNNKANDYANSFDYTQILIASAVIHGNGFALIERNGAGRVTGLMNIHPDCVNIRKFDGELWYEVDIEGQDEALWVMSSDMIHIKGFGMDPCYGISVLEQHRVNLGLSLAARDYGVDVFNKGTRIDGFIKYSGTLKPETKDAIAKAWTENYGPSGTRGVAILDGDSEYKPLQMKPEDAQFLQTRTFQISEIATILGVPPYMVGDSSKVAYNNMTMYNAMYLQSLLGWMKKVEQEYNNKLLGDTERRTTYYKLNFDSVLRADIKTRAEAYEILSRLGALSPNEIRALEDLDPYEGGDQYFIEANKMPVQLSAEFYGNKINEDGATAE